jgi:hypothetical protein
MQQFIENGMAASPTGGSIISGFVNSNPGYGIGYADGADNVVSGLSPGQFLIEPALVGDADLNGTVNIHDLQSLLSDFNAPGFWDQGNFNGHADVDISDLQSLLSNFNQTSRMNASESAAASEAVANNSGRLALVTPALTPQTVIVGSLSLPAVSLPSVARAYRIMPNGLPLNVPLFSETPVPLLWLQTQNALFYGDSDDSNPLAE